MRAASRPNYGSVSMSERMSICDPSDADNGGAEVGLRFQIQIGLVREQISLPIDQDQLTLPALRELCCTFVDRTVCLFTQTISVKSSVGTF